MTNEKVLRLVMECLGENDVVGFQHIITLLPSVPAGAIERRFYERLKVDSNIKAACRAAKRVAKNYVGKM